MNPYRLATVALCLVVSGCDKGSSCTTKDNGNGTSTLSCTDGTSTILTNGKDGTNGTNGTDGTNGANGDGGSSCSITTQSDGGRIVACTDGTTAPIPNGTACSIKDNGDGGRTISCTDGTIINVTNGTNGTNGANAGNSFRIEQFHGTDFLTKQARDATGKFLAKMTVTAATANVAGIVTVSFKIVDPSNNQPVTGIKTVNANIVKLLPADADAGESFNKWVSYIYRTQTVTGSDGGDWPNPDGTKWDQAYREKTGGLVDNNDGSYVYTFDTNLSNISANGSLVPYERGRLHRVAVMVGGGSGPTCDGWLDFVPDGTTVTESRRIIDTNNCRTCHGQEFHGHGGDRLDIEVCATCHLPGNKDPHGDTSLDLKEMIHKIHAGTDLPSIAGPDGIVWDDPSTLVNEAADNGTYAVWSSNGSRTDWWKVGFPAEVSNCTKCHNDLSNPGGTPQVANWKNVPSRKACGSCHDDADFTTGVNHPGGIRTDDDACVVCHPASGTVSPPIVYPITQIHDFMKSDPRNIPEFTTDVSLDVPARGYYVSGEAPVVTIVVKENGVPLDHTTIFQDLNGGEGCPETTPVSYTGVDNCPPRDGKFTGTAMFVHGPRARRNPVLTMAARTSLIALSQPTYNLGAVGNSMTVVADNGQDLKREFDTALTILKSNIVLAVPATGFVDRTAATPAEIIAWLNGVAAFKARAIAYLDEITGRLAIRSRNLGTFYSIQVLPSALNTAIFNDTSVRNVLGTTPTNNLAQQWNLDGGAPTKPNDPKVTWTTGNIKYQLDPVDDLAPGTYFVGLEFKDRGSVAGDPTNYRAPTVAKKAFQVKQLAEELPPARSCSTCHQSPETNTGMVFDQAGHFKILDGTAVDQCGQCHDYQNTTVDGGWGGAVAITRRVHALHAGATLDYPNFTVSHADPDVGRNWDITFPQDLRNCQVCHPDTISSGSWKTKPARLPCGGCHDSDAATSHMTIMTMDPTPASPYSGDEVESCKTCH